MGRYEPYQLVGICACCGMPLKADSTGAFNKIFDGRHYFCDIDHEKTFYANNPELNTTNGNNSGSSGETSSGAGSNLAGVGVGAAVAGAGMAIKGLGSLASGLGKGLGKLVHGAGEGAGVAAKGLGEGLGAIGKLTKKGVEGVVNQFGATRAAEDQIRAIDNMAFSSDPAEYKEQIFALYEKAISKPLDPFRDLYVIRAAKKKLVRELNILKLKNPELFNSQYIGLYEELNKKKFFR